MAFSLEDDFSMSALAARKDSEDDEHYTEVVTEGMKILGLFATGSQLADESLNH